MYLDANLGYNFLPKRHFGWHVIARPRERPVHAHMCVDMCMGIDMSMDMGIDMCIDMDINLGIDTHINLCVYAPCVLVHGFVCEFVARCWICLGCVCPVAAPCVSRF